MNDNDEDATRAQLKLAIEAAGTDAATLSREIGYGPDYIRDYLIGRKRSLSARAWSEIKDRIGFSVPLSSGVPKENARQAGRIVRRPTPQFLGETYLPVYAAAEGGPGDMVVSTDPIEFVTRPWFLKNVKEGYAVVVTGESMVPVYEPGDLVIVNPRLPAIRGKNAIFVSGEERGEFKATVKRLERSTPSEWHVRQWNPPEGGAEQFVLRKKDWPKALRIVGRYEGG